MGWLLHATSHLGLLFILIITLFVVGFGGRFFLEQMGVVSENGK